MGRGWGRGRGWGWGWALLVTLLVPAPALRCPQCGPGGCREVSCPSPHAACRRTSVTTLAEGRVLVREEGGCDVMGPPDVVITFRSHGQLVTLREQRCAGGGRGGEGCPSPTPPTASPAPGRPLLCLTCDSSDGSCGRPLAALRCPRPDDVCIDVITRRPGTEGEGRLRGCGSAGSCRGLVGFDTGHGRQVALRCCRRAQCEMEEEPPPTGLRCWGCEGPEPHGCVPRVVPCAGGLTHCGLARTNGPSGEPWLVRGCASPSWCESPVGLGGLRGGALPHCCRGSFCNHLPGDPPSAAPQPPHAFGRLLLLLLLLAVPHI